MVVLSQVPTDEHLNTILSFKLLRVSTDCHTYTLELGINYELEYLVGNWQSHNAGRRSPNRRVKMNLKCWCCIQARPSCGPIFGMMTVY